MRGIATGIGLGGVLLIALSTGCRKPSEAKRSELEDAGYAWTTEDWFRAARTDQVEAARKFLASGFDAGSRDESGDTALHAAAGTGAESVADLLLDHGVPPDAAGAANRTPLHAAVEGDQPAMVAWLIRQGADPERKDEAGFSPLMLAVREDHPSCIEELATYQREHLDDALLLAAITGGTRCIDVITNFGGSVYARMDDGRTPLMLAAENGQLETVRLLLELGASRYSASDGGRDAAGYARDAGFEDIAEMIEKGPEGGMIGLESPEEIGLEMAAFVDQRAAASTGETGQTAPNEPAPPPVSLAGAVVSAAGIPSPSASSPASTTRSTSASTPTSGSAPTSGTSSVPTSAATDSNQAEIPPLVMRHYRETELPLEVRSGDDASARVALRGSDTDPAEVAAGETVPGSRLKVVRVTRRVEDSKLTPDGPVEVPVVEVTDLETGRTRELTPLSPPAAHDPLALVEDAATGRRYFASTGQRFRSEDGDEYVVSDVRPNQLVIENLTTGEVSTIPLRGPRG